MKVYEYDKLTQTIDEGDVMKVYEYDILTQTNAP